MAKHKQSNSLALRDLVIEAISDKKGQEVVTLDLTDIKDTVADYFIITHGDSNTQVNAIYQSVLETTKKNGTLPYHSEGSKNAEWIIIDYVDVVVHIFYRETRNFYLLEELWNDAKIIKHGDHAEIKPAIKRPLRKAIDDEEFPMAKPTEEKRTFAQRRMDRMKTTTGSVPLGRKAPSRSRKPTSDKPTDSRKKTSSTRKPSTDKRTTDRPTTTPTKELKPKRVLTDKPTKELKPRRTATDKSSSTLNKPLKPRRTESDRPTKALKPRRSLTDKTPDTRRKTAAPRKDAAKKVTAKKAVKAPARKK